MVSSASIHYFRMGRRFYVPNFATKRFYYSLVITEDDNISSQCNFLRKELIFAALERNLFSQYDVLAEFT